MLLRKINSNTGKKLVGLFVLVILALVSLAVRITIINATDGEKYKRIVMTQAQQQYDSRTIAFRRGDILDRNGTLLASSEKVYNVILDCKVANTEVEDTEGNKEQRYVEPTIRALVSVLGMNETDIRKRLTDEETRSSQYQILQTNVSITEKKEWETYLDADSEENAALSDEAKNERRLIRGVWFEETYDRVYPLHSLACDVIGFTYDGTTADWGIEGYYSDILNGTNGRQYGYFNTDADVDQTIIEAVDGHNITSTIDINIQQIIRRALENFNDEMATDAGKMNGAKDIGVVVMNPNTGEILGMDSSRWYDLNDPRDLSPFYTREEIAGMSEPDMMDALSKIWANFCVSSAYEPGSVFKPVTAAAALETGAVSSHDTFYCDGGEQVEDKYIQCDIYPESHGDQTIAQSIMHSCNDALMQIVSAMGEPGFIKYEEIFGYGMRTGIDLPGESSGQVFSSSDMGAVEMATSSFGQGFTCTMIQEAAAIASVINGGAYYKPHVVSQISTQSGAVVQTNDPVLERRTVSEAVSAQIREAMGTAMTREGTGYLAKLPGYSMGGKTGTAEKLPRGEGNYVLSFVGFAPLDDPQVLIYVTVDEPNTSKQETSVYATSIARNVFTELLPYMNIYPDEEGFDSTNVYATMATNRDLLGGKYRATENGVIVEGSGQQSWAASRTDEDGKKDENNKEDTSGDSDEEGDGYDDGEAEEDSGEERDYFYGEEETAWHDPMAGVSYSGEYSQTYTDGTPGTALDGSELPSLAGGEEETEQSNYFSEGMTNEEADWVG